MNTDYSYYEQIATNYWDAKYQDKRILHQYVFHSVSMLSDGRSEDDFHYVTLTHDEYITLLTTALIEADTLRLTFLTLAMKLPDIYTKILLQLLADGENNLWNCPAAIEMKTLDEDVLAIRSKSGFVSFLDKGRKD